MNPVFHIITQAIDGHRLLNVVDESGSHIVEPYLVYESAAGDMVLHGWQRSRGAASSGAAGWCSVHLEDIAVVEFLPGRFASPRPEYNPRHPDFHRIVYEIGQNRRADNARVPPGRLGVAHRRRPPRSRIARASGRIRRPRE